MLGVVVAVHAVAREVERHQRLDPRAVEVAEAEHRVDTLLAGELWPGRWAGACRRVRGRASAAQRREPCLEEPQRVVDEDDRVRHHAPPPARGPRQGSRRPCRCSQAAPRPPPRRPAAGAVRRQGSPRSSPTASASRCSNWRMCCRSQAATDGRLAPQPRFQPRCVGVPAVLLRRAPDPAPQRLECRGARRSLGHRAVEVLERRLELREHHLLLRGEVGEEGARRDVGGRGDVGDRRRLESALGEEAHGGDVDRLARLLLLPFPQSAAAWHRILAFRANLHRLQDCSECDVVPAMTSPLSRLGRAACPSLAPHAPRLDHRRRRHRHARQRARRRLRRRLPHARRRLDAGPGAARGPLPLGLGRRCDARVRG